MDIRDNLQAYMAGHALKQAEVARRAGMTPSKLCAVIKKRRELEANELFRICDAMGTTPEKLRGYTEPAA